MLQSGPNFTATAHLLVGEKFSGKSLAVEQLATSLTLNGIEAAGFFQRGVFDGAGRKIGYDLVIIPSGETHTLARGRPGEGWTFADDSFKRGQEVLEKPADLYIIDEIGPLELRGAGHMPALRKLLEAQSPTLVVVREELAEHFHRLLSEYVKVQTIGIGDLQEIGSFR